MGPREASYLAQDDTGDWWQSWGSNPNLASSSTSPGTPSLSACIHIHPGSQSSGTSCSQIGSGPTHHSLRDDPPYWLRQNSLRDLPGLSPLHSHFLTVSSFQDCGTTCHNNRVFIYILVYHLPSFYPALGVWAAFSPVAGTEEAISSNTAEGTQRGLRASALDISGYMKEIWGDPFPAPLWHETPALFGCSTISDIHHVTHHPPPQQPLEWMLFGIIG